MSRPALHISMQLANQIFTCALNHPQAQSLGHIRLESEEAIAFTCQPETITDDSNTITVYRHGQPESGWNGLYIQIDNDTRGVMQLVGWEQTEGNRESWPVIAGNED